MAYRITIFIENFQGSDRDVTINRIAETEAEVTKEMERLLVGMDNGLCMLFGPEAKCMWSESVESSGERRVYDFSVVDGETNQVRLCVCTMEVERV